MLVGPPQVGKGALALDLARLLNCLAVEDGTPCDACNQCRRIAAGNHADVRVIGLGQGVEGGPQRREIGIGAVRLVSSQAHLKPYEGANRVFIFEDAELLSEEAANALLKTLEEPPPQTTLILVTSQEDRLLPTIRSRCRRVELRLLSRDETVGYLEEARQVEREEAERLAHLCGGRIGWALSALDSPQLMERRISELDRLISLLDAGVEQRFHAAGDLAALYYRERKEAVEALEVWLTWWRDLMLTREGAGEWVYNQEYRQSLEERGGGYSSRQITDHINAILDTLRGLERNVNPRVSLEALTLSLPKAAGPRQG